MSVLTPEINKGGYEFASYDGSLWLNVFSFQQPSTQCFSGAKEALHCNEENKFSILDEINPFMKTNGKYEFILEYPLNNYEYLHWRQSKNPVKEREIEGKLFAQGYENIHNISVPTSWGGLVRSNIRLGGKINTLLDGIPGTASWYMSIGLYCDCEGDYVTNGMPGYYKNVRSVKLWIRFNLNPYKNECTLQNKHHHHSFSIHIILLLCYQGKL